MPAPIITAQFIGSLFGSTLGNLLVQGQSPLVAIPVTTALSVTFSTVFGEITGEIKAGTDLGTLLNDTIEPNLAGVGGGAVASYLTGELLNAIGVKGTVASLTTTISGVTIGQIVSNEAQLIVDPALGTGPTPLAWNSGIGLSNLGNAIGGFVGSEVGSAVVQTQNGDGAEGGAVGSTVGTIIGAHFGGTVGAAIGSFIGKTVGTLIGDVIGGGVPSPQAYTTISAIPSGAYNLTFRETGFTSKDNGPVPLVGQLTASVVNALNGTLSTIGGQAVNPGSAPSFTIGVRRGVASYFTPGFASAYQFSDAAHLVSYATLSELNDIARTGIAGGDVFVKRAIGASYASGQGTSFGFLGQALNFSYNPFANGDPTFNASGLVSSDIGTLAGDLQVAKDYESYVQNSDVINALIQAAPTSAFAQGWGITLEQAVGLGLNKRAASDFTGGWGKYLATKGFDPEQLALSYTGNARTFTLAATGAQVLPDTIFASDKDVITNTTPGETISIDANGKLVAGAHALFNGAANSGQTSSVAAVIYAAPGNSVVYAGGQGDDVIGYTGAGFGNEALYAGFQSGAAWTQSTTSTWLLAGSGNDSLYGGASGGDVLRGGAGSDLLQAGSGSAWLIGGGGDGNTSAPSIYTLNGTLADDVFVAGVGKTYINAGSGNDTIVFGIGDGQATVSNVGGPNDELSLGAGINWTNIAFARPNGSDLQIQVVDPLSRAPTGDTITLANWFTSPNRVEFLRFDDGTKIRLGDYNVVFGTPGNNNLLGTPGKGLYVLAPGYGTIDGWLANNSLYFGNTGKDSISGDQGPGVDVIIGGAGDDTLFGGIKGATGGTDYIQGGTGNDLIIAGANGDTIDGGSGATTIVGGGGNDVIQYHLGDGHQTILNPLGAPSPGNIVANASGWIAGYHWVHYASGAAGGGGYDAVNNAPLSIGSAPPPPGTNTIIDSRLFGKSASGLNGYLEYNRTTQNLYYWSPDQASKASAGSGSSTIQFGAGILASNIVFAHSGSDYIIGLRPNGDLSTPVSKLAQTITLANYGSRGSAIKLLKFVDGSTINLNITGTYTADINDQGQAFGSGPALPGGSLVYGNQGNDTLNGGVGADTIIGGAGNNLIKAGTGREYLTAGNGNDTFVAGSGNDTIVGGAGFNTVSFANAASGVLAELNGVTGYTETGAATGDVITGVGAVIGSAFADTLVGGDTGVDFDGGRKAHVLETFIGGTGGDIYRLHDQGDAVINDAGGNNAIILDPGQKLTDLLFGPRGPLSLGIDYRPGGPTVAGSASYLINNQFAGNDQGAGAGVIGDLNTGDGRLVPLAGLVLNGTATGSNNALVVGNVETSNGVWTPIQVLQANSGNDWLLGTNSADTLIGGPGNNTFEAGGGANLIEAGTGGFNTVVYSDAPDAVLVNLATGLAYNGYGFQDTLTGGLQAVRGSAFNDTLIAGGGGDLMIAGNGNALILGGAGSDTLIGGTGSDTITAGSGNTLIKADQGTGVADTGTHVITGGLGADTIYAGGVGGDIIATGDGNAVVFGGPGHDTITGGVGNDTIYAGSGGSLIRTGSGNTLAVGGSGTNVMYAGAGNDTLTGGPGQNILYGGSGTDLLTNLSGDATLMGGTGRDTFVIGARSGYTTIVAPRGVHDLVFRDPSSPTPLSVNRIWLTQSGNDLVVSVIGATAQVTIHNFFVTAPNNITEVRRILVGGSELFLDYALNPVPLLPVGNLIQLMASTAALDPTVTYDARGVPTAPVAELTGPQNYYWFPTDGTAADVLTATSGPVTIVGGNGNNAITGPTTGSSTLIAGPGADTILGSGGYSTVPGSAGHDTITGGGGNDLILTRGGNDVVYGGAGNDTIEGDQGLVANLPGDWIDAGSGNTLVLGGTGSNVIHGGTGNDTLIGDGGTFFAKNPAGNGPDTLIAGTGDETLVGGSGANVLQSGFGADSLVGHGGNNLFVIDGFGAATIVGSSVTGALNTVSYVLAPTPIYVDLAIGLGLNDTVSNAFAGSWALGNHLTNVTKVIGSAYGGTIGGTGGYNYLIATGGRNFLTALGAVGPGAHVATRLGNDTLQAGTGDDTLQAGAFGDVLIGGPGTDNLQGGVGNDTFFAGTGNAYIIGNGGSDTYILGANFGQDTINAFDPVTADLSSLSFTNPVTGADESYDHLWFEKNGANLVISEIGAPGTVTISNWFTQVAAGQRNDYQIAFIYAAVSFTEDVNVQSLVGLMTGYTKPTDEAGLRTLLSAPGANGALSYRSQLDLLWQLDRAPTITGPAHVSGNEDAPITFQVDVSHLVPNALGTPGFRNAGATNITWSASSSNTGLTDPTDTNAGNTLGGSPQFRAVANPAGRGLVDVTIYGKTYQYGATTLTLTATDLSGAIASITVPVTIDQIVYPPAISVIPSQAVSPGITDLVTFTATNTEGVTSNLSVRVVIVDSFLNTLYDSAGGIRSPQDWLGVSIVQPQPGSTSWGLLLVPDANFPATQKDAFVTVYVTDELPFGFPPASAVNETFFRVTEKVTHLPSIAAGATLNLYEGMNESETVTITDADTSIPGNVLARSSQSWLSASLTPIAAAPGQFTLTVSGPPGYAGSPVVTISATDGAGITQSKNVQVTVTPVDYAKTVTGGTFTVPIFAPNTNVINPNTPLLISGVGSASGAYNSIDFNNYRSSWNVRYYKNNILQPSPDQYPIAIAQDTVNRNLAYIFSTNGSDLNWLKYDTITVDSAFGKDGGAQNTNLFSVTLSIQNPYPQPLQVTNVVATRQFLNLEYFTTYAVTVWNKYGLSMSYSISGSGGKNHLVSSGYIGNGGTFYLYDPGYHGKENLYFSVTDGYMNKTVDSIAYSNDFLPVYINYDPILHNSVFSGQPTVADTMTGGNKTDVLDGKGAPAGASDVAIGMGGNDTYVFQPGYGQLLIDNSSTTDSGPHGILLLGLSSIQINQVWFERGGDDLIIRLLSSADRITVKGWYAAAINQLASITLADGSAIQAAAIDQLRTILDLYRATTPAFSDVTSAPPASTLLATALATYWTPSPTVAPSLTIPVTPGSTPVSATGSAPNTTFVIGGGGFVNWTGLPADVPAGTLPAAAPTATLSGGGFGDDAITVDPNVTAPVYINGDAQGGSAFTNITGGRGDDILIGGATGAVLTAGNGAVQLYAAGNQETLIAGTGADTLAAIANAIGTTFIAGPGADTISGAGGTGSTVSYARSPSGVAVSLKDFSASGGYASGEVLQGITNLTGSAGNDTLQAGSQDSVIKGGGGNDLLITGSGNDTLDGSGGVATASFAVSTAGVAANLATGVASNGFGGTATLIRIRNLVGPDFGSSLTGDASANVLTGGTGNDTLSGGSGNDTLIGGGGTDTYLFSEADGNLVIQNGITEAPAPSGTLQLGAADTLAKLTFAISGNDLVVGLTGSAATATIQNWARDTASQLAQIALGGGGTLSAAQVTILAAGTPDHLWFSQSGNDLLVSVLGTSAPVRVANWFASASSQIAFTLADGSTISAASVSGLAHLMDTYRGATQAFDPTATGATLPDDLDGGSVSSLWSRTINAKGAPGNIATATLGADTVLFGRGYGAVTATAGPRGSIAAIQFGPGITADNVWFPSGAGGFQVQLLGTNDTLTLPTFTWDTSFPLKFADGSYFSDWGLFSQRQRAFDYAKGTPGFDPSKAASTVEALPNNGSRALGSAAGGLVPDVIAHLTTTGPGQVLRQATNAAILDGSGGNASLYSKSNFGLEHNFFVFGLGYGNETCNGPGIVKIGPGIDEDHLWFQWMDATHNTLKISILGTNGADTMTIADFRSFHREPDASQSGLSLSDGSLIDFYQIAALADWMTAYAAANKATGFDPSKLASAASVPGFQAFATTGNGGTLTPGWFKGAWSRLIGWRPLSPQPVTGGTFAPKEGTNQLIQSVGDGTLVGNIGNDVLYGGQGNVTFIGGGGTDDYNLGVSIGRDVIVNGVAPTNGTAGVAAGSLELPWGRLASNLWFDRVDASGMANGSGNDLKVDLLGTRGSVTIRNWFTPGDTYAQLSSFVVRSSSAYGVLDTGLGGLMGAMITYEINHPGFDPAAAANGKITDPMLLTAVASAWHQ